MKKTKILFLVAVILILSIISSKYSKASSNSIEDGNTSIQVNKSADDNNYQTYSEESVTSDDTKTTSSNNDSKNISAKLTIVDTNGEDFSKGNLTSSAYLKIDGIDFESNKNYYVAVAHTKTEPTYNKKDFAEVDKKRKSANISGYVEETGDLYVWVYSEESALIADKTHTTLISGEKVERPEYPSYGNRIIYAFGGEIETNVPRKGNLESARERKITVKIGKVTDSKILRKIKNKDSSGMSDLLAFAKKTQASFETTINSTSTCSKLDLSKLDKEKGAYYFIYFVMDDENGTYYPVEDVNLLFSDINNLLFNQSDDGFKWEISDEEEKTEENKPTEEEPKDNTVAPTRLSNTGEKVGILILIAVAGISALIYNVKAKKLY